MKTIILTRGKVALVDDADFEALSKFKWHAYFNPQSGKWYAIRSLRKEHGKGAMRMHRQIMKAPAALLVDHRNGDGLDNRRDNLRLATMPQNMCNRGAQANNSSGYKGVNWDKALSKWKAQIEFHGKKYHIGYFIDKRIAYEAYAERAKRLHGEFAHI